jgi:putative transposase
MAGLGLHGVIRGKPIKTTTADRAAPCPLDHVNRQFHAPAPRLLPGAKFDAVGIWRESSDRRKTARSN